MMMPVSPMRPTTVNIEKRHVPQNMTVDRADEAEGE